MAGKTAYKNDWLKKNCDRINLTVPKGKKEKVKAFAKIKGDSLNSFIVKAIDEKIERDTFQQQ